MTEKPKVTLTGSRSSLRSGFEMNSDSLIPMPTDSETNSGWQTPMLKVKRMDSQTEKQRGSETNSDSLKVMPTRFVKHWNSDWQTRSRSDSRKATLMVTDYYSAMMKNSPILKPTATHSGLRKVTPITRLTVKHLNWRWVRLRGYSTATLIRWNSAMRLAMPKDWRWVTRTLRQTVSLTDSRLDWRSENSTGWQMAKHSLKMKDSPRGLRISKPRGLNSELRTERLQSGLLWSG